MLASDLGLDLSLPGDTSDALVGDGVGVAMSVVTAGTLNESPAEGENTPAGGFSGVCQSTGREARSGKLYGAAWCPTCTVQKELFEDGADFLPFIEVTNPDRSPKSIVIRRRNSPVTRPGSFPTVPVMLGSCRWRPFPLAPACRFRLP